MDRRKPVWKRFANFAAANRFAFPVNTLFRKPAPGYPGISVIKAWLRPKS